MKVFGLIAILVVAVTANNDDCTPLRCTLPLKEGNCQDAIHQFYFDNETKQCRPFVYTGCDGNVNRFRTVQLCQNTCLKPCQEQPGTKPTTNRPQNGTTQKPLPRRCTLELDPGSCNQAIPRFYYDDATRQCKSFNYSGCEGNVNNFRSQELCEEVCLGA